MSDESDESADGDDEFTWGVSEPEDPETVRPGSDATGADRTDPDRAGSTSDSGGTDAPPGEREDPGEDSATSADDADEEHEPTLAGVVGANQEDEPARRELAPESPSIENAAFLLVGVLFGIYVVYEAATAFGL